MEARLLAAASGVVAEAAATAAAVPTLASAAERLAPNCMSLSGAHERAYDSMSHVSAE
mgnify:CR=1 FL=1